MLWCRAELKNGYKMPEIRGGHFKHCGKAVLRSMGYEWLVGRSMEVLYDSHWGGGQCSNQTWLFVACLK